LKRKKSLCELSVVLYTILAPFHDKYSVQVQEKLFKQLVTLAYIISQNGSKVSEINAFKYNQQTLIKAISLYFVCVQLSHFFAPSDL